MAVVADAESGLRCAMRSSPRVLLLDLLRLVASVQMVQGHTIDAVLSMDYRRGALHHAWLWARGLTSVAFLFGAGMAFHLATLRDLDGHRSNPGAVAARFRRALGLVLLGYVLRLPLPLGVHEIEGTLEHVLAADVLQCIGASLALLEGLALTLPGRRSVEVVCGVLAVLVLALSPAVARLDPAGRWLPLLDYLTPRRGSPFPLFPWTAHMFLGVALCPWLLPQRLRFARLLLAAGATLMLASLARKTGLALVSDHVGRLGWVVVGLALLSWLEPWARAAPSWLWRLSRETLFIYAFHVLLVYGQGLGLATIVGRRLSPLPAAALALGMLALSFGGALGYRRLMAGLARRAASG
jgi:uncharacterized membrane protein